VAVVHWLARVGALPAPRHLSQSNSCEPGTAASLLRHCLLHHHSSSNWGPPRCPRRFNAPAAVHSAKASTPINVVKGLSIWCQFSVILGSFTTRNTHVESNGGSLENVAEIFVLFLCGVQLVLRSGVLTVLDLDSTWSRQNRGGCRVEVCWGLWVGAVWGWWLCWWLAVAVRNYRHCQV